MLNGWIKLHRETLSHWVSNEPELLAFWVRLLMDANHCEVKKMFNGSLITIKRGELIFGLEAFSAKSSISISKLRRYLKLLESDSMINRQKTNKYSIISIVNYDEYQGDDSQDDRQSAGKEQADDRQTTGKRQHRKNVKNDKNEKNDKNNKLCSKLNFDTWPDVKDMELVEEYLAHKKRAKASISQRVINGIGEQLTILASKGYSVERSLLAAIDSGWKGFEAEWVINKIKPDSNKQQESSGERKLPSFVTNGSSDYIDGEVINGR